jgi:hypothetical protein
VDRGPGVVTPSRPSAALRMSGLAWGGISFTSEEGPSCGPAKSASLVSNASSTRRASPVVKPFLARMLQ